MIKYSVSKQITGMKEETPTKKNLRSKLHYMCNEKKGYFFQTL